MPSPGDSRNSQPHNDSDTSNPESNSAPKPDDPPTDKELVSPPSLTRLLTWEQASHTCRTPVRNAAPPHRRSHVVSNAPHEECWTIHLQIEHSTDASYNQHIERNCRSNIKLSTFKLENPISLSYTLRGVAHKGSQNKYASLPLPLPPVSYTHLTLPTICSV